MKRAALWVRSLVVWAALAGFGVARADVLAPRVETFAGEYKMVRLQVEAGWPASASAKSKEPRPFTLLLTFRDGAPAGLWAHGVSGTKAVMHLHERDAKLTASALQGRLGIFSGSGTTKNDASMMPIELELNIAGQEVTGTIAVGGRKPAAAKGTLISTAELAKENAFAPGRDWPAWQGVDASVRGPTSGLTLVDSLAKARPVWRSEAVLPVAFGNAPDFRYALRAAVQGTGGGASSPVVAGGRVFVHYYVPSGSLDEKAAEAALVRAPTPLTDFQEAWVKDMYRNAADDVVVALDAATGRLLWRTTLPLRTLNLQTHKHRGVSPTPLADGDALYVVSYAGRVYRFDAATGAVRWEFPEVATKPFAGKIGQGGSGDVPVGCASPVLIGGTLGVTLRGQLIGISAESGKTSWQIAVGRDAQLYAWNNAGKLAFLAAGRTEAKEKGDPAPTILTLVNAVDGQPIWKAEADFPRHYRLPVIAGDLLLAYRFGAEAGNSITTGAQSTLIALRLKPDGVETAWQLTGLPPVTDSYGLAARGGFAYLSGENEVWAVELQTGKVVAKVMGTGGARTQLMWTAEDRVFLCPEGRHGSCALTMLTAHGPPMKLLGATDSSVGQWQGAWPVANPFTTAYANHQIIHPVVDGRLFVRGADGVYCYDLRSSAAK